MGVTGNWAFIVNPVAGNGFASDYVPTVKQKIKDYSVNAELFFTSRPGHARELSSDLIAQGFDHIIVVGGDGTINEAAYGLMDNKDITFGVVAAGTGNDFIQILGFSDTFSDKDWDVLFEKKKILIDVGQCNGRYFLNGMGLGFDAQVASENYAEAGEVKSGSKSKYIWHILKNLVFFKEKTMYALEKDNRIEQKFFMNTISIGRRFAGGYYLTPNAIANDGLLDICLVGELSLGGRINLFMKVPTGSHTNHPKVKIYQTEKLILEFDHEVPHHLDGELYFAKKFEVSILPQKLNIIYNPSGTHYFNVQ